MRNDKHITDEFRTIDSKCLDLYLCVRISASPVQWRGKNSEQHKIRIRSATRYSLKWNAIWFAFEKKDAKNKITQRNVSHHAIIARIPLLFTLSHFLSITILVSTLCCRTHKMLYECFVFTLCHLLRITCTEHSTRQHRANGSYISCVRALFATH